VIQIKHGPIDFQVREPVSPLLGGWKKRMKPSSCKSRRNIPAAETSVLSPADVEGSARFRYAERWQFHTRARFGFWQDLPAPLRWLGGRCECGHDTNWLAHPLAMANLYGFGRLAWDPTLSAQTITEEWTRLTFGNDATPWTRSMPCCFLPGTSTKANEVGLSGQVRSPTFSEVTTVPGRNPPNEMAGAMAPRRSRGIGMDRTVATGTGYVAQYSPALRSNMSPWKRRQTNCSLVFHHVPYSYKLHSGKAVIQHIYDSHMWVPGRAAALVSHGNRCKAAWISSATKTCCGASSTRQATPSSGATPSATGLPEPLACRMNVGASA